MMDYRSAGRAIDPAPGAWFIIIHLINTGYLRPSKALQVQNRGGQHHSFKRKQTNTPTPMKIPKVIMFKISHMYQTYLAAWISEVTRSTSFRNAYVNDWLISSDIAFTAEYIEQSVSKMSKTVSQVTKTVS